MEKNKNNSGFLMILRKYILPLIAVSAMVAIDQWTKYLTVLYVKGTEGFYIIDKVLRIYFVKNEGMAWGMLQNKQVLFIIITPIVIFLLAFIYYRIPFEKKYILARVCILLLTGGAIGNLLDRIFRGERLFHGYVVDMIYAEFIDFPVFNVADSFITVGFAILIFSIIFIYKEKDFDTVFPQKKKHMDTASGPNSENVQEPIPEVNDDNKNKTDTSDPEY